MLDDRDRSMVDGSSVDEGFTMVEVVVSIVLLGLAALVVLPAIITGSRAAVGNRDISRATQYASAELSAVRSAASKSATCATALAANGGRITPNPTGYTITDAVTGACAVGSTIRVTTTVTSTTNAARSATATTLVLVAS